MLFIRNVELNPQTDFCVLNWELLSISHSFLLLAVEDLRRQAWNHYYLLTIINTASVIASVVVSEIAVKSPPCTIKSSDVIL